MDENDALIPFGLERNAVIDEHHLRNRGEVGEEIAGIGIRVHGRTGCPSFPEKKSGQVLVRTLESENPSQMRLGRSSRTDRKSTRLNSSHRCISYAVFCL